MKSPHNYIPSRTLSGATERFRQHSFTGWIPLDLLQEATDFAGSIGLVPIYAEHAADFSGRYLFWSPPPDACFEVRSGRTEEQFREFDQVNIERGWSLLTLNINAQNVYSAVWIRPDHYDTATEILSRYGITPAQRIETS